VTLLAVRIGSTNLGWIAGKEDSVGQEINKTVRGYFDRHHG
jgi:hypothetical protein